MRRFWKSVIQPIFEEENIKTVIEVGSDRGDNTRQILHYVEQKDGILYAIDPYPSFPGEQWEADSNGHFKMIRELSLNVLDKIDGADAILIDGDHNWYTVYNELMMIKRHYTKRFPLIFFHDICWPYDRRDLYYNPDNIPSAYRHKYRKASIKVGSAELSEWGMNSHLFNAEEYGTEQNGVKTAVEDFLNESPELGLKYYEFNAIHGLGMIASEKDFGRAIEIFTSADTCRKVVGDAEKDRLRVLMLLGKVSHDSNALRQKISSLKDSSYFVLKIYPDFGEGFSEENAVEKEYFDGNVSETVSFEKPPVRLRIDPVNRSYCIVTSVSVSTDTGILGMPDTNGRLIDGAYVFDIYDSQLLFDNPKKAVSFDISMKVAPFRSADIIAGFDKAEKYLSEIENLNAEIVSVNNKLAQSVLKTNELIGESSSLKKELSQVKADKAKYENRLKQADSQLNAAKKESSRYSAAVKADRAIGEKLTASEKSVGLRYALKSVLKRRAGAAAANIKGIKYIRKNGGFDFMLYCRRYPDVFPAMDPLIHFIWFGGYEGRDPSDKFGSAEYLRAYPDVAKSGINPYVHYLLFGKYEGRKCFAREEKKKPAEPEALPVSPSAKAPPSTGKALSSTPTALKYIKKQIVRENAEILKNYSFSVKGSPLVSIIIINHNGTDNLKILFDSFKERTFYKNFEIIIVDNASTDNSLEYIKSMTNDYKIKIIENNKNESFSKANNQAISEASGEYVLFLNNDIEVTDYWLDCMLYTAQTKPDCGAVGARLIYPDVPAGCLNHNKSFTVQHFGIVYSDSSFENKYFVRPMNFKNSESPFLADLGCIEPFEISGVTAACMLVKKSVLDEIGGFDEKYVYGYEDCDLNLSIFRKGYKNYVCPTALLFHYEFGTQSTTPNKDIVTRRTNNIHHFKDKWQEYLQQKIWTDKLNKTSLFTDHPLTVAVVVTDDNPSTAAGDYFTGMELCTALQTLGYKTKFLPLSDPDCYNVGTDTDILISLLEKYNLENITNASPALITIAWARNWFDRWCNLPYIQRFTYIFASSKTACKYMQDILKRDITLFPIAANSDRFNNENSVRDENSRYFSDYVFTGSYWNSPREIIEIVDPDKLPYNFKVFGANWDKIPKFAKYYGGLLNYSEMPEVYRNTRIVVDDANLATKPYGAVNSRVFDALAAGRLVVTNGVIGANETFEGKLPSFETAKEFNRLISFYLSDDKAYNDKVNELRDFVLKNHTYAKRAEQLIEFIGKEMLCDDKKIALMIPVPKYSEVEAWGDYHFSVAMKKQFERNGFTAEIRILPEWNKPFDGKYVIVLRGLSIYKPQKKHINIMWNISHPDDIPLSEYEEYDKVYVSSEKWTEHLKHELHTDVETLMQCTDEEVFYPSQEKEHKHELLFVGNSRKIFRKIIKDLLPTPYKLSVYGTNWGNYIDSSYIKGENIPNRELGKEYGSCDILLNDHWDDMRDKGFVSNRIFDGLSAGAFIITDEIDDMDNELKQCVVFYKDKDDLAEKIKYYMEHPDERRAMAEKGMKIVREKHTFKNRTEKIIEYILTK